MEKQFATYISLRDEIDLLAHRLQEQHHKHMHCKKACDLCCINFSILPIEFYHIKSQLKKNEIQPTGEQSSEEKCVFLQNHLCTIYQHRPIICRTHGLPLLYLNSDTEEWELSACELNFNEFDDFDNTNTYPQDKFNSRLFMLNEQFLKANPELKHGYLDLIPVRNLLE